jgi:hypothetical protein
MLLVLIFLFLPCHCIAVSLMATTFDFERPNPLMAIGHFDTNKKSFVVDIPNYTSYANQLLSSRLGPWQYVSITAQDGSNYYYSQVFHLQTHQSSQLVPILADSVDELHCTSTICYGNTFHVICAIKTSLQSALDINGNRVMSVDVFQGNTTTIINYGSKWVCLCFGCCCCFTGLCPNFVFRFHSI